MGKGQNLDFLLEVTLNEGLYKFTVFQEKHHIWETSVSDLKVKMLSLTGIDQYFWFFSMKIFTIFTLFLGETCFLDVWGNMFP